MICLKSQPMHQDHVNETIPMVYADDAGQIDQVYLIHEYQHKQTRVNTNQHKSTRINTSQHESTRVRRESTRINASLKQV